MIPEGKGHAASDWDAFLHGAPLGQFQQLSGWANAKALDGWNCERIHGGPEIGGGFQLLWKTARVGRVGYISKGPVLLEESPERIDRALGAVVTSARRLRLRAVILQPPDQSRIVSADLCRHGFEPDVIPGVIRATAIVNLSGGKEAYLQQMSRQVRREVRVAAEKGVTVRRGTRDDLPLFFDLMCGSCARQNTRPNPSRVEFIQTLWDTLGEKMILGFAMSGGEAISALLMIGHRDRLTFWKKGWNSAGTQLFANCLLNVTAFDWAAEAGYREVDFLALGLETAHTLLRGDPLSEAQRRSRDVFNLRLGAGPRLLPAAQILVVSPALRAVYRLVGRRQKWKEVLLGRMGSQG